MKNVKVKFADKQKEIQIQAADDIDEVLSNLEFDPYLDARLKGIELLTDLVSEFKDDSEDDIITGMHSLSFNDPDNDYSWIFSIGEVCDVPQEELDENEYSYHFFITEDKHAYVYYSLCE